MPRALIVVDVQNDFVSGSLAVPGASEILDLIGRLVRDGGYACVVLTQDWHPRDHVSFASHHPGRRPFVDHVRVALPGIDRDRFYRQRLWPDHCVQNSWGARLAIRPSSRRVIRFRKGIRPDVESYSAFEYKDGVSTGLADLLRERGIDSVDVCGLALDYCVRETAQDAARLFSVRVIMNAVRAVNPEFQRPMSRGVMSHGVLSRGVQPVIVRPRDLVVERTSSWRAAP